MPNESITGYIAIKGLLLSRGEHPDWIGYMVLIIFAGITPFYLKKLYKVNQAYQLILAPIVFLLWAISIGCPLNDLYEYTTLLAVIFAGIISAFSPLLAPSIKSK
jgi:hypothetical protein